MKGLRQIALGIATSSLFAACTRSPLREPEEAMRELSSPPKNLDDDLPLNALIEGLDSQISFWANTSKSAPMHFGKRTVTREEYLQALKAFVAFARIPNTTKEQVLQYLRDNFSFFEVYGDKTWGDVFMTSYFEPVVSASTSPDAAHSRPLYKMPDDLVEISIPKLTGFTPPGSKNFIGRLLPERSPSGALQIVPYSSRKEIDQDQSLAKRKLELAWVDPIDAFVLQIQGSGTLEFPDKSRLRVGYAGQNGQKYEAVGAYLKDVIPADKLTLHTIEAHLRSLSAERMQDLLNKNPSYVFFKENKAQPLTYMGTPVVPGRTLATDTKYFPKGALGVLFFDKPVFPNPTATEVSEWKNTTRIVIDQDKGGAINGGGRLDLFWGSGPEAKQAAGVIKNHGRLYYLAPKLKKDNS